MEDLRGNLTYERSMDQSNQPLFTQELIHHSLTIRLLKRRPLRVATGGLNYIERGSDLLALLFDSHSVERFILLDLPLGR